MMASQKVVSAPQVRLATVNGCAVHVSPHGQNMVSHRYYTADQRLIRSENRPSRTVTFASSHQRQWYEMQGDDFILP